MAERADISETFEVPPVAKGAALGGDLRNCMGLNATQTIMIRAYSYSELSEGASHVLLFILGLKLKSLRSGNRRGPFGGDPRQEVNLSQQIRRSSFCTVHFCHHFLPMLHKGGSTTL